MKIFLALILIAFSLPAFAGESKAYEVTGNVISIDEMRPYPGPPRPDKCYEKHHNDKYTIVTVLLIDAKPSKIKKGDDYKPLENKPRYFTFAIEDSENTYEANAHLGKLKEEDSFSATAINKSDECVNETWLSNLVFHVRRNN